MIYSQVGLIYRHEWTTETAPSPIKDASMEQARFIYEYQIPFLDNRGEIQAGNMRSDLKTDYSTLALRILSNNLLDFLLNILSLKTQQYYKHLRLPQKLHIFSALVSFQKSYRNKVE